MTDRDRQRIWSLTTIALTASLLGAQGAAAGGDHSAPAVLAHSVGAAPASVARMLQGRALRTLDGRDASIAATGGDVVVVNFWATWCRPCLKELPALQRLHEEIRPRGGRVLAVSIDADRRNVERFARNHSLVLPMAHDGPAGLARSLDLKAVPLTVVLDRSGAVAHVSTRSDEAGVAETRAAVLRLLARPAPPPALAGESAGDGR